jgi:hypothetical protein
MILFFTETQYGAIGVIISSSRDKAKAQSNKGALSQISSEGANLVLWSK